MESSSVFDFSLFLLFALPVKTIDKNVPLNTSHGIPSASKGHVSYPFQIDRLLLLSHPLKAYVANIVIAGI